MDSPSAIRFSALPICSRGSLIFGTLSSITGIRPRNNVVIPAGLSLLLTRRIVIIAEHVSGKFLRKRECRLGTARLTLRKTVQIALQQNSRGHFVHLFLAL